MKTKVIAYYLPQFYETKENNEWWGKGYTEWKNAQKAKPLFHDHYQPREPLNNNYYDLSNIETMRWQAELAKKSGVYGFAFYHYWFGNGKMMLEKPAENLLKNKDVNMRFCFSWANENWTRTWEGPGGEKEVLINQVYGDKDDWKAHFEYMFQFFNDKRYIKKDGKPILLIYRLDKIPNYKKMFEYWNELARKKGLEGIYIVQMFFEETQKRRGVDAYTLYAPSVFWGVRGDHPFKKEKEYFVNKLKNIKIPNLLAKAIYDSYDYDECYEYLISRKYDNEEYMGVFTDFDNTARKGEKAAIWFGSSPRKFKKYFSEIYEMSMKMQKEFLFITAWNEWGEGNYMEPDKRYGYAWLKAVRDVVSKQQ